MKKRIFIAIILLLTMMCLPAAANAEETEIYNGVYNRIYSLKEKFPDGMHWNHLVETDDDIGLGQKKEQNREYRERFADSVTSYSCAAHSSWETTETGQYDCNFFDGGCQCYGFARKIFYDVYGIRVSQSQYRYDYRNIQVGDYVRYGDNKTGHSFIVLSKDGNMVKALECNWGGRCVIYWGVHTYDLEGAIISVSGKEFRFNHYVHASNYDEINIEYSTPSSPILPAAPVGTYGVVLGGDAYATENPFYDGFMKNSSDCDSCTWYAWGRACEKLGIKLPSTDMANTWEDSAGDFKAGASPKSNSIAIWTNGDYGYASFVEKYENEILYVSESNFSFDGVIYSEGYIDSDGKYTGTFASPSNDLPLPCTERGLPDFYIYLENVDCFDLDGNDRLDTSDAIYLLRNIMCRDRYPVTRDADVNGDGVIDAFDAIYLSFHIAYPDKYPLA